MKRGEWVLIIAALVLATAIYLVGANFQRSTGPAASSFDPANATYTINGRLVPLFNGLSQTPQAPGSASLLTTRAFGKPAIGDLNGDGIPDAGLVITQDGGGSGTFYYVAAALNEGGTAVGTNAFYVGDRIAPQSIAVGNGVIIFNYADRNPGEPMATPPSVGVSRYFAVQDGALTEIH